MRYKYCLTWNMARKTEKGWKWEMHTLGTGMWHENWKSWKMRNTHSKKWNMLRNTKNGKWEMHTVGSEIWREKLKNVKDEKNTL